MNSWGEAKNILCVRLDAMGDVLMTTPAMKLLKEALAGRTITLLTSPSGAKIAESIPLFDDVIVYEAPWLKASGLKNDPAPDFEMIKTLKDKHFDGAVIFTVYSQNPLPSALMLYLTKIPLRAAYCRENPYSLLTHWIKEEEPEIRVRHEVKRHLDLVEKLGCQNVNLPLVLKVKDEAQETLRQKLEKRNVQFSNKWIIIHAGSTAESRRYSEMGFAEISDRLIEEGFQVLFTGSPEERELICDIEKLMKKKAVNLVGELSLNELIALISKSPLLISNNSGPVHMAAALGTPVVVLYALTNPQHTPWLVPHHVLYYDVDCKFCYKSVCPMGTNACLNMVRSDEIVQKAMELLHSEEAPSYDFLATQPLIIHPGEFA